MLQKTHKATDVPTTTYDYLDLAYTLNFDAAGATEITPANPPHGGAAAAAESSACTRASWPCGSGPPDAHFATTTQVQRISESGAPSTPVAGNSPDRGGGISLQRHWKSRRRQCQQQGDFDSQQKGPPDEDVASWPDGTACVFTRHGHVDGKGSR